MLTLVIIKMSAFIPIMAMMAMVIRKLRNAERDLLLQRISWQQYEALKQSSYGFGFAMFIVGLIICSL